MSFYEFADANRQIRQEKVDVELTQLREAPADENPRKTWFEGPPDFWWATDDTEDPFAYENVRRHTPTDLASVPRFMWGVVASYGQHTLPALLHDWGCDTAASSAKRRWMRRKVDQRFRQTLHQFASTGFLLRWLMWSAVRMFGFPAVGISTAVATLLAYFLWVLNLADVDEVNWWIISVGQDQVQTALWIAAIAVGISIAVAAFEHNAAAEVRVNPGHEQPNGNTPVGEPGTATTLFVPGLASMLGAVTIGVLAVGPLLPVIAVTFVTNLVISILDLIAYGIGFVGTWVWNSAFGLREQRRRTLGPLDVAQAKRAPKRPRFNLFPGP